MKTIQQLTLLRKAIMQIGSAHEAIEQLQDMDKKMDKIDAAVLKSVDLNLAKSLNELDYLDKKSA